MKILERSDERLVLEDQPWLLGVLMIGMTVVFLAGSLALFSAGELFGGLMMAGVGGGVPLLIMALIVQRVRLTLDRRTGQILRARRSVIGFRQTHHDLSRLRAAQVGVSHDSDGTTYRLELVLADPHEIVPFTSYYTSGARPGQLCEAVNAWRMGRAASA